MSPTQFVHSVVYRKANLSWLGVVGMRGIIQIHRHGFKMDEVSFPEDTHESQVTLLAGNCMSIPVIGAMIMGLLVTADFNGRLSQFRQYIQGVPPMLVNKHIVVAGSILLGDRGMLFLTSTFGGPGAL